MLGGSVGLAARQRGVAGHVAGLVRRAESVGECLVAGAVDAATQDLAEALEGSALVILCTPVGDMADMAARLKPHLAADAIVTDVGSVKASVVRAVEPVLPRFVGSHPLCGSEKAGVAHARGDLFEGAACAVTPTGQSDAAAVEMVSGFWTALGGKVVSLTAEDHDTIVARTSHLPHVVASALVNAVLAQPRAGESMFLGTGFRDTTRLADSDGQMWLEIASANRVELAATMKEFELLWAEMTRAVEAADGEGLRGIIDRARSFRGRIGRGD